MIIEKLHFQNVSRPHVKENTAFSDKPRFRNGLAWVVGRSNKINKGTISNSSGVARTGPYTYF